MLKRTISPYIYFFDIILDFQPVLSQPTWTFDPFGKEKKPEKYENRKLGSEKTADKKFTVAPEFYTKYNNPLQLLF